MSAADFFFFVWWWLSSQWRYVWDIQGLSINAPIWCSLEKAFLANPFLNSFKILFPFIGIKRKHINKTDPSKDSQVIVGSCQTQKKQPSSQAHFLKVWQVVLTHIQSFLKHSHHLSLEYISKMKLQGSQRHLPNDISIPLTSTIRLWNYQIRYGRCFSGPAVLLTQSILKIQAIGWDEYDNCSKYG